MIKKFLAICFSILISIQGIYIVDDGLEVKASTTNTTNYLAIMIEFSDLTTTSLTSDEVLDNANILMNDDGTTDKKVSTVFGNMPITSLKKLIKTYSYGKEDIQTSFFPQDDSGKVVSYVAPHPRTYYMKNTTDGYGTNTTEMQNRRKELLEGALAYAKQSIEKKLNADELDRDHDGKVDAITFFVEGDSYLTDEKLISWTDLLWSHKGEIAFSTKLQGKNVYEYNLINTYKPTGVSGVFSLNRSSYGTVLHEYMHTLGLPDLYRGYDANYPVGYYDLMGKVVTAAPQGMLAYHLSDELGWHQALPIIKNTQRITLKKPKYQDDSEQIAVKIETASNTKEIFVAEYYTAAQYVGAKGQVSDQDGLLLYRVKTDEYNGNFYGSAGSGNDQIYIFRPNESGKNVGDGQMNQAVLRYGTSRSSLGKTIDEVVGYDSNALYYSNGLNSGVQVNIVSQDDESITFDVTIPAVKGTGTKTDPYLIENAKDLELLKADSYEKPLYYKLMKNIDLQGKEMTSFSSLHGVLDGNGFTIKNAKIKGAGFINKIEYGAELKNLTLSNLQITYDGSGYVGGVTGENHGKINNVHVNGGKVIGSNARNSGGVAGTLGSAAYILDSSSSISVASTSGGNGGLVGLYQGKDFYNSGGVIKDCFVNGNVIQGTSTSGAVIGSTFNTVSTGSIQNVYYDKSKTGLQVAKGDGDVEGIDYVHLSSINFNYVSQGTISLADYWKTSGNIIPDYSIANASIASISNSNLVMKSGGSTKLYANLKIGSNTYQVTTIMNINLKTMNIQTSGYNGTYDGKAHSIEISGVPAGSTIKYRTNTTSAWSTTKPSRKVAGTSVVYYQITNPNYKTVSGSAKIVINQRSANISASGYNGTYDGKAHSIVLSGVPAGSTIKYRTSTTSAWSTTKPSRKVAGTSIVYYQITNRNYKTVSGSAKIVVNKKSIGQVTIGSISNKIYTGQQIKPGVTIKHGTTYMRNGVDYTVSYGTNKATGSGYVKINGKGNYTGTIIKYFNIVPKAPSVSIKAGNRSLNIVSKSVGASGYQIAYSTNKTKGYQYMYVGSNKTVTGLKKNTTYYVKVRAYKTINGKKVYGAYSGIKIVKTK